MQGILLKNNQQHLINTVTVVGVLLLLAKLLRTERLIKWLHLELMKE